MNKHLMPAMLLLFSFTPVLHAQVTPGYAVIDGTQNPPQIVYSNVNVAITDGGTGSYTLVFDEPVVFFSATSMSKGPSFDAGPTMLTVVVDSSDERRVRVTTRTVGTLSTQGHGAEDAQFSLEVHF